jgi:hypothetical protein
MRREGPLDPTEIRCGHLHGELLPHTSEHLGGAPQPRLALRLLLGCRCFGQSVHHSPDEFICGRPGAKLSPSPLAHALHMTPDVVRTGHGVRDLDVRGACRFERVQPSAHLVDVEAHLMPDVFERGERLTGIQSAKSTTQDRQFSIGPRSMDHRVFPLLVISGGGLTSHSDPPARRVSEEADAATRARGVTPGLRCSARPWPPRLRPASAG